MSATVHTTNDAHGLVEMLAQVPPEYHQDVLDALAVAAQSFRNTRDHDALDTFVANLKMTLGLLSRPDFVKQLEEARDVPPEASAIGVEGWVARMRERVES